MTDIFAGQNKDYDGSGSPATATGPIQVTYSGTLAGAPPKLYIYVRVGSARFAPTLISGSAEFGTYNIELASGANYYFKLVDVVPQSSFDLSTADL